MRMLTLHTMFSIQKIPLKQGKRQELNSVKADSERSVWNLEELETCPRMDMTSGNPVISRLVLLLKVNYYPLSVILVFLFLLLFLFVSQNMSFSYL